MLFQKQNPEIKYHEITKFARIWLACKGTTQEMASKAASYFPADDFIG